MRAWQQLGGDECYIYLKLLKSEMQIFSAQLFNLEATAATFGMNAYTLRWSLVAAYSWKTTGSRHITFLPLPSASFHIDNMEIELHCIAWVSVVTSTVH